MIGALLTLALTLPQNQVATAEVDVMQLAPPDWERIIGADVALDPAGAAALSWLGWKPKPDSTDDSAGETLGRAGLEAAVCDGTWVQELHFMPEFEGSRPFGLRGDVSDRVLEIRFGAAPYLAQGERVWQFHRPDGPPFELVAYPEVEGRRRLDVRCSGVQLRRWYKWMTSRGGVSFTMKREIKELWRRVLEDSASLKGREIEEEGLFGPIIWWHSKAPLCKLLGGSIQEIDLMLSDPMRKVRYVLRMPPGAVLEEAADLLAPFEKARKCPEKATSSGTSRPEARSSPPSNGVSLAKAYSRPGLSLRSSLPRGRAESRSRSR